MEKALRVIGLSCVSCFLLVWHLICSRDQALVTQPIDAFAAVVPGEACMTYSCGFQELSHKNTFEGRLVFVVPSVHASAFKCPSFSRNKKKLAFLVVCLKKS